MANTGFQELEVWQVSMHRVRELYVATRALPKDGMFGLTGQIRRAAVSIPANIAEGYGRNATREYIQFIGVASGSQAELTTLLLLAKDLYPVPGIDGLVELNNRVGSMLRNLKIALRKKVGA